jgi:hypothetical protein
LDFLSTQSIPVRAEAAVQDIISRESTSIIDGNNKASITGLLPLKRQQVRKNKKEMEPR